MKLAWRPSHTSYRRILFTAIFAGVLGFFTSFIEDVITLERPQGVHLTGRHNKASYAGVFLPAINTKELRHNVGVLIVFAKISTQTAIV